LDKQPICICEHIYSKKINLLPDGIPPIENKAGYEPFISDYTQEEFNQLLEASNFDTYIRKKMGVLKRSSSSLISSSSSKKQSMRLKPKKSIRRYRTVRKKKSRPSRIRTNARRIVSNRSESIKNLIHI
jgi:hypothetical protein